MSIYTARKIIETGSQASEYHKKLGWIPARPINYRADSIRERIRYAWGVLVGKYDALNWEDQDL